MKFNSENISQFFCDYTYLRKCFKNKDNTIKHGDGLINLYKLFSLKYKEFINRHFPTINYDLIILLKELDLSKTQ